MKTLLLSLLIMPTAFATATLDSFFNSNAANTICQDAMVFNGNGVRKRMLKMVKSDENYVYFVFSKREGVKVLVTDFEGNTYKTLNFNEKMADIITLKDEVIFLTEKTMYVAEPVSLDLKFKTRTLPNMMGYAKNKKAMGVYKYEDIYYVAHGEYGIIPFDAKLSKHLPLINPSLPQPMASHRSMMTDITGVGSKIYLAYDDVTLSRKSKAFEGIAIFDLATMQTSKIIPVNQRMEAYYMPRMTIQGDEMVITNLHLNFRHKLKKLESDKYMRPFKRIWKYPKGDLLGRGLIQKSKLYGCFYDHDNGQKLSSGSFSL